MKEQYKNTKSGESERYRRAVREVAVSLLLCSTWIHPFLSAFHSHSLPRSLTLSLSCSHSLILLTLFFSAPRLSTLSISPPSLLKPIATFLSITFIQLLSLWTFFASCACVGFFSSDFLVGVFSLSGLNNNNNQLDKSGSQKNNN